MSARYDLSVREQINDIYERVKVLNDWHNTVNTDLAVIKTNFRWVLLFVGVSSALAGVERAPGVIALIAQFLK